MHDHNTLIERRTQQFDAKHGDSVRDGNWYFFEDGATREANFGVGGALVEPPDDPCERMKRIVHYHTVKLQRLVEVFDPLVAELEGILRHSVNMQGFDEKAEQAERLKRQIRRRRVQLNAAKKELARHQPGYVQPADAAAHAAADAKEREHARAKLNELKI